MPRKAKELPPLTGTEQAVQLAGFDAVFPDVAPKFQSLSDVVQADNDRLRSLPVKFARPELQQVADLLDSGEPFLIIRASDPRSFAVVSIVKSVYVTAQLFEHAANARQVEKDILAWKEKAKYSDPPDTNPIAL